jgi:HSP20 family protein
MTKKKSFFQRLTGNLNLDDLDEDIVEETNTDVNKSEPQKKFTITPTTYSDDAVDIEEEIGELAIDMHETSKEIVVQAFIAGVPNEHLSITISRDAITISGKREEAKIHHSTTTHIKELYWGTFERTIELPDEVDVDAAEAMEKHGMLIIKMPKIDKGRKTTLKVKPL